MAECKIDLDPRLADLLASLSSARPSSPAAFPPVRFDRKGKLAEVGDWQVLHTIGKGATGKVRLAVHKAYGSLAAVKCVTKSKLKDLSALRREVAILKMIDHEYVLRLYDVVYSSDSVYIIMEYAGSELFDFIEVNGRLRPREATRLFWQIASGVAHCHSLGIVHRDIKLENLLLDDCMNIKIADFGMAWLQDQNKPLTTCCGSPHYASPEVVSGLKYDGKKADVWSLGVVLYAMLTAQMPFQGELVGDVIQKVKAGAYDLPGHIPRPLSSLLRSMLVVDPQVRMSLTDVLDHEVFKRYLCVPTSQYSRSLSRAYKTFDKCDLDVEIVEDVIALSCPEGPYNISAVASSVIQSIVSGDLDSRESELYSCLSSMKSLRANVGHQRYSSSSAYSFDATPLSESPSPVSDPEARASRTCIAISSSYDDMTVDA